MTPATLSSTNCGFAIGRAAGAVPRRIEDRSGIGVFASTPRGWFEPQRRPGCANHPSAPGGLDSIESKTPVLPPIAVNAAVKTGRLAILAVGIPFAAVFILGCLTL